MENYRHILAAVDLHSTCDRAVIERAQVLAEQNGAKLSLIHAVEHINAYGAAYAYPAVTDLETTLVDEATEKLAIVALEAGVPEENQFIEFGSPKTAIIRKARELPADLIMVGSHGRHGLALLLGSAANAVLHGAPCDVLAVLVQD